MKKILIVCAAALLAIPVLAQVKSSVIKNTADTEVFSIGYGSGVATVTVAGVISATELVANSTNLYATQSDVLVNSNLTVRNGTTLNTVSATGAVVAASTLSVRAGTTVNTINITNSAVGVAVSGSATVGGSLSAGTFVSSPYYQIVGEGQTGRLDVVVVTGAYNLVYIVGNTTNTVAADVK